MGLRVGRPAWPEPFHGIEAGDKLPRRPRLGYPAGLFYQNTGYNRWADSNHIAVLYPQARATTANPNSCWDWWGYDDANFAGKSGGQMVAIKTMIVRRTSAGYLAYGTCP